MYLSKVLSPLFRPLSGFRTFGTLQIQPHPYPPRSAPELGFAACIPAVPDGMQRICARVVRFESTQILVGPGPREEEGSMSVAAYRPSG